MKYINLFEKFKGKTSTYLYDNIHDDKNGDRLGICKNCRKLVDITKHDPIKKDGTFKCDTYTGKHNTYQYKNIYLTDDNELMGTCIDCGKVVNMAEHNKNFCKKKN